MEVLLRCGWLYAEPVVLAVSNGISAIPAIGNGIEIVSQASPRESTGADDIRGPLHVADSFSVQSDAYEIFLSLSPAFSEPEQETQYRYSEHHTTDDASDRRCCHAATLIHRC
jgi:hypothetical protein